MGKAFLFQLESRATDLVEHLKAETLNRQQLESEKQQLEMELSVQIGVCNKNRLKIERLNIDLLRELSILQAKYVSLFNFLH